MQPHRQRVEYEGEAAFEKAMQSPEWRLRKRGTLWGPDRDVTREEAARMVDKGYSGVLYAIHV